MVNKKIEKRKNLFLSIIIVTVLVGNVIIIPNGSSSNEQEGSNPLDNALPVRDGTKIISKDEIIYWRSPSSNNYEVFYIDQDKQEYSTGAYGNDYPDFFDS